MEHLVDVQSDRCTASKNMIGCFCLLEKDHIAASR